MPTELPPLIESLRKTIVVEPLRNDPRHTSKGPLGLSRKAAISAIGWGQANFDEPFEELSSKDRVMLYAYWNQKRHLEELTAAFGQFFSGGHPEEPLIVIDLGCGPFTGGLALAGHLGRSERFDYIGVDRSRSMRLLGEQFAAAADKNEDLPDVAHFWFDSVSQIKWQQPSSWREVVIIVSFLLASDSLDVANLVNELHQLLPKLSRGGVTVIYTNSEKAGPNSNFPAFKKALSDIKFRMVVDEIGEVETVSRPLRLRYALFRRHKLSTLELGEN